MTLQAAMSHFDAEELLEIKQDFEEWYYTENSTEKSFIVESLCKFEIEFLKNRIFESLNDIKLEI